MPNTTPSRTPPPCDAAFHISSFLVYRIICLRLSERKIINFFRITATFIKNLLNNCFCSLTGNELFPYWEYNVPKLGIKCSLTGNKTFPSWEPKTTQKKSAASKEKLAALCCFWSILVPRPGIEPGWIAPLVFETSASTDSAIWA